MVGQEVLEVFWDPQRAADAIQGYPLARGNYADQIMLPRLESDDAFSLDAMYCNHLNQFARFHHSRENLGTGSR